MLTPAAVLASVVCIGANRREDAAGSGVRRPEWAERRLETRARSVTWFAPRERKSSSSSARGGGGPVIGHSAASASTGGSIMASWRSAGRPRAAGMRTSDAVASPSRISLQSEARRHNELNDLQQQGCGDGRVLVWCKWKPIGMHIMAALPR